MVVKEKRVENRMKKRNEEQEERNRVWLFHGFCQIWGGASVGLGFEGKGGGD